MMLPITVAVGLLAGEFLPNSHPQVHREHILNGRQLNGAEVDSGTGMIEEGRTAAALSLAWVTRRMIRLASWICSVERKEQGCCLLAAGRWKGAGRRRWTEQEARLAARGGRKKIEAAVRWRK
jgi:hypothetical protein